MSSLLRGLARNALLSAGAVAVGLVALHPRVTIAEEVADYERLGEGEEDGQRFGDIVIKGELVATANAPGGWSLVRTVENKSDTVAEADIEERVVRLDAFTASRTGGIPTTVITRHQKFRLKAHEKRVVGTTFAKEIDEDMTRSAKIQQGMEAYFARTDNENMAPPPSVAVHMYSTEYLRALRPGEIAQRPMIGPGEPNTMMPPPMPVPEPVQAAKVAVKD